ncbi:MULTISPECIES: DNA polymerase III subunit chi [Polaromonas]|uniref:DNA polymerase III subunit chi n=1 Tax=Polaromonas aquatica TaxID=332657 RepID=A0ABW1TT91_9BURK
MTEIEFHFNVPDKLLYGCRLLRKVHRNGIKAVVMAEPGLLGELDQLLWQFSPTEFVPHCLATASAHSLAATPLLLAERLDGCPPDSVLINLGQTIPGDFERFERFIEVVSGHDEDRLLGRGRWKHYKDRGYALKQHDLAANRESA